MTRNNAPTWAKIAAGLAIAAVAVAAGWVSYTHIYELSIALGQSPANARLIPIGVDGLITVGSVALLLGGGWLGWFGIVPGVIISVFANVESGMRYGALAAIWAGIPAVSFFVACFILERWLAKQTHPVALEAMPVPTPDIVPELVPVPVPSVSRSRARARLPEHIFATEIARKEIPGIRAIKTKARCGTKRAQDIHKQLTAAIEAA